MSGMLACYTHTHTHNHSTQLCGQRRRRRKIKSSLAETKKNGEILSIILVFYQTFHLSNDDINLGSETASLGQPAVVSKTFQMQFSRKKRFVMFSIYILAFQS